MVDRAPDELAGGASRPRGAEQSAAPGCSEPPAHTGQEASAGGSSAPMPRVIVHVDMDAFFASVETLDNPELRGKPVVVGGTGPRGVVASCSYEARAYGVRSAMPTFEARRLCPDAVFLAGRYSRYAEVSEQLHRVLATFTPLVEAIGLDEAFLDVSRPVGRSLPPHELAAAIRRDVVEATGIECSVGVGTSKLIAKLASEAAKPPVVPPGSTTGGAAGMASPASPGIMVVDPAQEIEFLHAHHVGSLWGAGPATVRRLEDLGVHSVGELAAVPLDILQRRLGAASGAHLYRLSRSMDERAVVANRRAKSLGHERTFPADLSDPDALRFELARMVEAISERLVAEGLHAGRLTLKVRFADRQTITRSRALSPATCSARVLRALGTTLLGDVDISRGVRLLGVAAGNLTRRSASFRQLALSEAQVTRGASRRRKAASAGTASAGTASAGTASAGTASAGTASAGTASAGTARSGPGEAWQEEGAGDPEAWQAVEGAIGRVRVRYGQGALGPLSLLSKNGIDMARQGESQWGPGEGET